jgi:hypothetical protein
LRKEQWVSYKKMFLVCLASSLVPSSKAGVLALTPEGDGNSAVGQLPSVVGWEFAVSSTFEVDGLGFYDMGNDGLVESHQVGIFDAETGALVSSAVVPAATAATLLNGFRIVPVDFWLSPGTYVIGGQLSALTDAAQFQMPGISTLAGIQYLQERELQTSSFQMPTGSFLINEKGIFGPDFTVANVPEPGTSCMFIVGAVYALAYRRLHSAPR